jgi:hypothetical protein
MVSGMAGTDAPWWLLSPGPGPNLICEMLAGTKPTTGATHMFFLWNNQSSCIRQVVCFKDCKDTYLQYFAIMLSCVQKSSNFKIAEFDSHCWMSMGVWENRQICRHRNSVHGNWGFGFCNWGLGF